MRSNIVVSVLVAFALVWMACAPRQPEPVAEETAKAEVEAALNSLREAYVTATNAGDAAGVANLFAEDAMRMAPNAPAEVGREAIQSGLQASFDTYANNLTASTDEIEVAGDWAFSRGSYTITLTPKAGGQPTEDAGKWLNVSKRQPDGSWKITRHIWNSNNPLPAPPK